MKTADDRPVSPGDRQNRLFTLTAEDWETIRMALKRRIDSLWSIEMSDRQKGLRTRYKVLFEKIEGDYNQNYEYDYLNGNE